MDSKKPDLPWISELQYGLWEFKDFEIKNTGVLEWTPRIPIIRSSEKTPGILELVIPEIRNHRITVWTPGILEVQNSKNLEFQNRILDLRKCGIPKFQLYRAFGITEFPDSMPVDRVLGIPQYRKPGIAEWTTGIPGLWNRTWNHLWIVKDRTRFVKHDEHYIKMYTDWIVWGLYCMFLNVPLKSLKLLCRRRDPKLSGRQKSQRNELMLWL